MPAYDTRPEPATDDSSPDAYASRWAELRAARPGNDFERFVIKHPFTRECLSCGLAIGAPEPRPAREPVRASARVVERPALQPDPRMPPV